MQPTQIKINRTPANDNGSAKPARHVLNLNNAPVKRPGGGGIKKVAWLLLAIALLEGAAIAWLYLQKPVSPYQKLVPSNAVASTYFDQQTLLNLIKTQRSVDPVWPLLDWGESALKGFMAQAKINQPEQLLAAFDDQMALAILPQVTGTKPTWLILASVKAPDNAFSQVRDQIEQNLKQNFNLISALYRQINISQIQPLSQGKSSLFYAQASGYFILTNNESLIKETIDRIIK